MWIFSIAAFFLITVILKIHETDGRVPIRKRESTNGNCVDEEGNEHALGEPWNGPDCTVQFCTIDEEGEVHQSFLGCPMFQPLPGCHLQEDPEADFPYCCPIPVCRSEESEDEEGEESEDEKGEESEDEEEKKT